MEMYGDFHGVAPVSIKALSNYLPTYYSRVFYLSYMHICRIITISGVTKRLK